MTFSKYQAVDTGIHKNVHCVVGRLLNSPRKNPAHIHYFMHTTITHVHANTHSLKNTQSNNHAATSSQCTCGHGYVPFAS